MKKVFTILICICFLMLSFGCSSKLKTYTTISVDELYQKIEIKESFILTIGSSQCSHCISFQTKMETVIKLYQIEVFYVDTAELTEKEYNTLLGKMNFAGTPTTIFFKDGQHSMSNRIEGDKDIETIESKMKQNGYIEE